MSHTFLVHPLNLEASGTVDIPIPFYKTLSRNFVLFLALAISWNKKIALV